MDAVNPVFRIERTIILVCYATLSIYFIAYNLKRILSNKKKYVKELSFISFLNVKFTSNLFGFLASFFFCVFNIDAHGAFKIYSSRTRYILTDIAVFFMIENFLSFAMLSLILERLSKNKSITRRFKYFLSILPFFYFLLTIAIDVYGFLTRKKFFGFLT